MEEPDALLQACEKNNVALAIRIIGENRVDLNFQNSRKWTALILASARGLTDIVNKLLEKDVNVNITTDTGDTALMYACAKSHVDIALMLLKVRDINVNAKNNKGDTALLYACDYSQERIALALLAVPGIEVNAMNNEGETALAYCGIEPGMATVRERLTVLGAIKPLNGPLIKVGHSIPPGLLSFYKNPSLWRPKKGGKQSMSKTQRKRKRKCRLVVGKRETCCIRPKGTKRRISRKMKRNYCK